MILNDDEINDDKYQISKELIYKRQLATSSRQSLSHLRVYGFPKIC